MFKEAYGAAVRYYKAGPWYHHADIWSGLPTQQQTTSLQAFWPGAPCGYVPMPSPVVSSGEQDWSSIRPTQDCAGAVGDAFAQHLPVGSATYRLG